LGVVTDKDIIELIVYDYDNPSNKPILNLLYASLKDARNIVTQDAAYEYVSTSINYIGYPKELQMNKKHQYTYINNLLKNDFLPNVGKSFKKKAIFLGYMTARLLKCFIGREAYDDRDNYINKRVDLPGILLGNLFRYEECYNERV
jgi:DNA-directed RNA polymerase II subunit RPB2